MKHYFTAWTFHLCILSCVVVCPVKADAQKSRFNVAIFLYQGVELLDFAGPTEVFAATEGFHVYTVSVDGENVLSQGLLTIKPEYSIDQAPIPDIIVFPGGSSGASSRDEKVQRWARLAIQDHRYVMSVCTGAFILARSGLIDDLQITTHHGSLDALQNELPKATVLKNTRFVDNDHIITTAGVSAGIDGALHLVARIKGLDIAKATAHYMEYDKWNPDDGLVATLNPYFESAANQKSGHISKSIQSNIPFEGELTLFVTDLNRQGKFQAAADWIEQGVKWYPNSAALYEQLRMAYGQLLKPVPIDEASFFAFIDQGGMEEAEKQYQLAQASYPGWKIFSEEAMNLKGYAYLNQGEVETALAILKLNTKAYPESGNVWDSLGEAYMVSGNNKEAIRNYQKSLQKNPDNANAKAMLLKLKPE